MTATAPPKPNDPNAPLPKNLERAAPIAYGARGIQIATFEDLYRFARAVIESGLVPSAYKKPEQIVVVVQYGAELGLSPMQSVRSFAPIGAVPALMVRPALALIENSGQLAEYSEGFDGAGDARRAWVRMKRKSGREITREFSIADAKRAGLAGKDNWKGYPDRMLYARACGFAAQDLFPDVLRGIGIGEEAADYGAPPTGERNITPPRSEPEAGPDPLLMQLEAGEERTFELGGHDMEVLESGSGGVEGHAGEAGTSAMEAPVAATIEQDPAPAQKRSRDAAGVEPGPLLDSSPPKPAPKLSELAPGLVKPFQNRIGKFKGDQAERARTELLAKLALELGPLPSWAKNRAACQTAAALIEGFKL